ncbi:hypothetical protein CEP54_002614 [Fusarium duplospermum]|uniref:WW domain-containing protein n=1 Tax=Fusarium duplospermum TaxID=1325734 RepID=A0A428QV13_9HYPO|nr:hypothetical protein CEP54_002614 [Fusarium duplospermum]
MADTRGGSVEFLEAMSELSAMQQAFFQVSNIRSHEMLPAATVNAASHIVLSSMDIIAKFLERSKHYQRVLGDSRASTFESSWCKIGWTLYKSHELRDLRDTLHAKLALVNILLSTASYCTPMAQHQVDDENAPSSSPEPEREPLRFKDAVGRKFSFPFHLCATWQGMEDLIKQAFLQVDVLGPHVAEGHYDLIGPDGEIILPTVWEKVVQPGWSVTMTMWPMEKPPMPSRHAPTDIPEVQPPLPAGWEIKSDASGRPYLVDHNTATSHWNPPDDGSHQSSRTTAAPPMPSAPQSTAPGQVPTPQTEVEADSESTEFHHRQRHSSDARDSPEPPLNEMLSAKEELARRIKELDTITQRAVIEIVNDMREGSRITQGLSKMIIKAVKTMSLDSFEDAISTFQAQMSSSEVNLSQNSSVGNTEGQASFGDILGNAREHKPEVEDDSGISVEGQDNESDASTSDSEDWEDYTDDEKASEEDEDRRRSGPRYRSPTVSTE